jgi:RimJ/RimL family protein N-acetyltransferase
VTDRTPIVHTSRRRGRNLDDVAAVESTAVEPAAKPAGEPAVTLSGFRLLIRAVQEDDKPLLAEGFARLSERSRYRRFFRPLDRLSDRDLAYLTEIDHHDHEALAGIDPDTGDLIGVARYVRSDEAEFAEVSVVVGDPWQRRGVATALLERLVERARLAGITHFVALVMDENTEALKLFEHRLPDQPPPRRSQSGHLELLMELPEPGRVRESTLGGVLNAVAHGAIVVNPYRVTRDAIRRLRAE